MNRRKLITTLTLGFFLLTATPLQALTPEQLTLRDNNNQAVIEKVKQSNKIVQPENIAELKGQLTTPEGKSIPYAKIEGAVWKDEKTRFALPPLYTDENGFWSIKVDQSSFKYISMVIYFYPNIGGIR